MAKRYNARVLIDGAQTVAHLPVNVQQLDSDFFVFSGHKIFGPTGIGVVYGRQELLEIMPPWQGGGSMIRNVTFEETTYAEPPAKFEAGTPNIADAVGLGAALDYVSRLGLPNIAKYEQELLQYGTEQLSRIDGLRIIGTAREKVGVLSFVLKERRTRGNRPAARSGRHRGSRRTSLLAAIVAAIWRRSHRAALSSLLQYERGDRSIGRRHQDDSPRVTSPDGESITCGCLDTGHST